MKDRVIKAMAERVGQTRAEKFWALFVERLCDGIEPEDGDTFKREDIEKRFENNPVARDAFIAVLCGEQKEPPKTKKFKAGRSYTAAEYVEHYERSPENPDLLADIARATDGKPWVVFTTKFHAAESAKFIQWHMDEDIAPATIDVGGVPVAPVLPGQERAPKEAYVDPLDPGTFLDVEMGSRRTGACFKGYSDEALSATQFLYLRHLTGEGNLSLNGLVTANRGKSAAEILAPFPSVLAEWNRVKPEQRPKAKATKRPFAEPPAPTMAPRGGDVARPEGWVPTIHVHGVDCNDSDWRKLDTQLALAVRAGHLRITSRRSVGFDGTVSEQLNRLWREADAMIVLVSAETFVNPEYDAAVRGFDRPIVPVLLRACGWQRIKPLAQKQPIPASGKFLGATGEWAEAAEDILAFAATLRPRQAAPLRPEWTPETLRAVHAAIIRRGLDRGALLAGIPANLGASIPRANNPSDQVMRDLMMLKDVHMSDGSNPLREYIANAAHQCRGQREEVVFREAMAALGS